MWNRLISWVRKQREWRRVHDASWSTIGTPSGDDGLTDFQRLAEQALVASVGPLPVDTAGDSDMYLTAKLPNTTAVIYIYADGAQIHAGSSPLFIGEREDYLNPSQLIERFVSVAHEFMQPRNTSGPKGGRDR